MGDVVEEVGDGVGDEGVEGDVNGFERIFIERDDADVFAGEALLVGEDGVVVEPGFDGAWGVGVGNGASTGGEEE